MRGISVKREILIIYDEDAEYVKAFSEYVNNMSNATFSVAAFTELESMLQFINNQAVRIILMPDRLLCTEILELNIHIMLLSDEVSIGNKYQFSEVWKYQSGKKIIREVSDYCAECIGYSDVRTVFHSKKSGKVLGVYSPVHRCGATTFAINAGILASTIKRTLYINLEEFSGLREILQCEKSGDLSELMYFYVQGGTNLSMKLSASVHTFQNMDYIPPMLYTEDIRNIDIETWISFIEDVAEKCDYEIIILDLSNMVPNVAALFSICDIVFVPEIQEGLSKAKLNEFKDYIHGSEYSDNFEKLKFFDISQMMVSRNDISVSGIGSNRYSSFVRNIVWDVICNE